MARFERELDWLLARFQPVNLDQVIAWKVEGASIPRKALFLSFDDGFREMAEVVAPICKRKGVPATFFLTTEFLDNCKLGFRNKASVLFESLSKLSGDRGLAIIQEATRMHNLEVATDVREFVMSIRYANSRALDDAARLAGLDFEHYLLAQRPYLTSGQVRDLLRDGFSIGAHSLDHPRYSEVTFEEQIRQTRGSIEFLKKHFGVKQRAFAFPFVSDGVSDEFYSRVFSEGACDAIFCIGQMPRNPEWPVIERFGVERPTNEAIWTILRDQKRRRFRARVSRLIAPLRQFAR